MITTLFIDFGGVLTKEKQNTSIRALIEKKAGFSLEKEFKNHTPIMKLNRDSISFQEFTKKINEIAKLNLSIEEMQNIFKKSILWNKKILDFLPKLKKNHRLILFSNNNHFTVQLLRAKHGLVLDLFDRHYFSCELKLAKPDPKFFNHALKDLNLKAEECLLIDDKKKNIKAAQELGMKGIVFQNTEQLKQELKILKII